MACEAPRWCSSKLLHGSRPAFPSFPRRPGRPAPPCLVGAMTGRYVSRLSIPVLESHVTNTSVMLLESTYVVRRSSAYVLSLSSAALLMALTPEANAQRTA